MKVLRFLLLLAMGLSLPAFAQQAELRTDAARVSASGGQVKLTAAVSYDGAPGAVGWSIALPAGWKLVSVAGPNVPAVAPEAGSSGQLDFAYTAVPAGRAEFSVWVSYPAGAAGSKVTATALVRNEGKLATLTPAPVVFAGE